MKNASLAVSRLNEEYIFDGREVDMDEVGAAIINRWGSDSQQMTLRYVVIASGIADGRVR